jgi:hypothetical protein
MQIYNRKYSSVEHSRLLRFNMNDNLSAVLVSSAKALTIHAPNLIAWDLAIIERHS